ncbi:1847_t:CDS:1, partial [Dentiscutata heterogama]
MDQNDSIFQYESEDISNNILEHNSDSIYNMSFEYSIPSNLEYSNLERTNSLCASESSYNSEQQTLDSPENLASPSDGFDYSDSSNINPVQNRKKHKSVFVKSSNKKPNPGKSWVWHHMRKDKYVKKETICKVPVNRDGKIGPCGESFSLLSSTSTLGAHLRSVHRLSEKGSLLPLSGIPEQPAGKKSIYVAQKDPTQPT